jgi:hypothetical protein
VICEEISARHCWVLMAGHALEKVQLDAGVGGPTAAAQSGSSARHAATTRSVWRGCRCDSRSLREDGGRGSRRGQAEHLAAVLGPGQDKGDDRV